MRRFGSRAVALVSAAALSISFLGATAETATADAASAVVAPTPAPPDPGTFVSLEPTRVLDTRTGNGASPRAVAGSGTVELQITGRGGVPSSGVSAVVVNVTVVSPTAPGFITVFPTGGAQPAASTLNFAAHHTIPNLATVKVGSGGRISLTNNSAGTAHLLADVAGYYVAGEVMAAGAFVSLAPTRILDTRVGNGASGPVRDNGTLELQVAGRGGIPASGVSAVVLNLTVTAPRWGGFLLAHPSGGPLPMGSSINFGAQQTIANLATVKLGEGGRVALYNHGGGYPHLIADVAGYYLDGVATLPGAFVALDRPTRFFDSRGALGTVLPNETRSTQIAGRFGVAPRAAAVVVANITATIPETHGFLTAYPHGSRQPTASNVNFRRLENIANLSFVRVGENGRIDLTNNSTGAMHLLVDVAGYFLGDPRTRLVVRPAWLIQDQCGTVRDRILFLDSAGISYSPAGGELWWWDENYRELFVDSGGNLTVRVSADPGFVLDVDDTWVVGEDRSATRSFTMPTTPCATP